MDALPEFEVTALDVFRRKLEGVRRMADDRSLPRACRLAAERELQRLRGAYVRAVIKAGTNQTG